MKSNILLTSVGRRSYLVRFFKDALGSNGKVFVANSSPLSPAFSVADGYVVSPLIYDENYIPFLLDYCKDNNITIIISLFDIDLPVLAKNKSLFKENGITVVVSDYEVIEKCNDKWLTYKFLKENGFNTAKTYLDINHAKKDLENNSLAFPLFIKPRWGMGSISVFKAENINELEVLYNKVKREVHDSYLKYESSLDKNNCVLIQQMINGQEYGLDVINDLNGNYIKTVVKKKIAMRAGETDCAQTLIDNDLTEEGKRISSKLGHIANLDVDIFKDGNNKPYILEMNARFGGGYPFSHLAGVNLPKAILLWLNNENPSDKLFEYQSDLMFQKDISIVAISDFRKGL